MKLIDNQAIEFMLVLELVEIEEEKAAIDIYYERFDRVI